MKRSKGSKKIEKNIKLTQINSSEITIKLINKGLCKRKQQLEDLKGVVMWFKTALRNQLLRSQSTIKKRKIDRRCEFAVSSYPTVTAYH